MASSYEDEGSSTRAFAIIPSTKKFDFVVRDKADVHTFINPEQAQKKGQAVDLKRVVLGRQVKIFFFFSLFP